MWQTESGKLALIFFLTSYMAHYHAYEYQLEFVNEEIFSACPEYPDNFLTKLITWNELSFETNEESTIYINGTLRFLRDTPNPYPVYLESYKKVQGQWENTIYNLHRADVCKTLFTPIEWWFKFTQQIPPQKRQCPFKANYTYDIGFSGDIVVDNIPTKSGEGEYKIVTMIGEPKSEDFICVNVFMNAYRV